MVSFTGLTADAILGILTELISCRAVRKQKATKGSMSESVSDLLGWRTQDEYTLTGKGLNEISDELAAWSRSRSYREEVGRTIVHRLKKAGKTRR
jgi:hypothetical protein